MSTKQFGLSVLVAAVLILSSGCAHQLTVLNLDQYHESGRIELPGTATIGVLEGDIDPSAAVLVDGVAAGLRRSGAQVQNPYRPAADKPADLVARIGIKGQYDGSGTNFWLNFPGFLIWAPAWNGYVYKADLAVHVDLYKGSDMKTVVGTLDFPVSLDIRHAEMDRTWMEVSWFEVGIIALVTGFIYTKYDTDVTPILMKEIERPIGEYIAHKILAKFPRSLIRDMKPKLHALYPETKPYAEGDLRVSKLHTIHYEECGNPKGKPICFLHGGPGGGIDPVYRRYFDPKVWRIVLHDQRGCGRSTPFSELRENTTWNLVSDIEKLREHLGIARWVVFGGSWGSTLSLAYAQAHPERVKALVLRGIFLLRQSELEWFYQQGASQLFPDAWEGYLAPIPPRERKDMMKAYYARLTSTNRKVRLQAARAWSIWEGSTSKLFVDQELVKKCGGGKFADAFARIEAHYFVNKGFLRRDDQLLADVKEIRKIPGVIVQGRYDVVCPMRSAWDLHRAWPEAKLIVVGDSGHSMSEPGIRSALIEETKRFARL